MADIPGLAELIRQNAYRQAGGLTQQEMDQPTKIFNTVNQSVSAYDEIVKSSLERKKLELQNQKLQQENRFIPEIVGAPNPVALTDQQKMMQSMRPEEAMATGLQPERVQPMQNEMAAANQSNQQRASLLEPYGGEPAAKMTLDEWTKLQGGRATQQLAPYRIAQTNKIVTDPTRQKVGELFPTLDDAGLTDKFGAGVTKETPYQVALGMGKLRMQQAKNEKMFPVSSLSSEGQAAAQRSGLPEFIPESTARIINGANPIKLPSFEESTALVTGQSIQDKIAKIMKGYQEFGKDAVGAGNYYINKFGQYVPFVASDPRIVDFYANINSVNNAMIYYMSGKQINEQEGKRIKAELFEPELNYDAFGARANTVNNNFQFLQSAKTKATTQVGKRDPLGPPNAGGAGGANEAALNKDLFDANDAIGRGADKNAVRQRLLKDHPSAGNLIDQRLK